MPWQKGIGIVSKSKIDIDIDNVIKINEVDLEVCNFCGKPHFVELSNLGVNLYVFLRIIVLPRCSTMLRLLLAACRFVDEL